jgi:hypothetical protein
MTSSSASGLVAGPVHVLCTEPVGLQLHVASVAADQLRAVHLRCLVDRTGAGDHVGRRAEHLVGHGGGLAPRVMARGDVGDFVADHPGELLLAVEVVDEAAVHVDKPAGRGVGVDLRRIDHREGELGVGHVAHGDQALPDLVHVGLQLRVVVGRALGDQLVVHLLAGLALARGAGHDDRGAAGGRVHGATRRDQRQRGAGEEGEAMRPDHRQCSLDRNCSSCSPNPSQAVPCTGAMMGIGTTTAGM